MSAEIPAGAQERNGREPVLDTVDRVSEMCFGLFMALTFVGAVSVATGGQDAGEDPGRTLMKTALGCNLAWGLVDAIMYLVRTLTTRGQRLTLALEVRDAASPARALEALRGALPRHLRAIVGDGELEAIRARIASATLPSRPRLGRDDYLGAVGIFLIVVLSTFPVALPFVLLKDVPTALLVSRGLTLAMLFGGGYALGRYAGYGGWKAGIGMMVGGILLTIAIIALGG